MLLIPFDRKIDWRQPPLVTLLLIMINVVCFVFWQAGEDRALQRAMDHYASSGLVDMEYPHFERYLRREGRPNELPSPREAKEHPEFLYFAMLQEGRFVQSLDAGEVIKPHHNDYESWQRQRQLLNELLGDVTFIAYGWKGGAPDLKSLFAHMFLHADVMHLLGNLFFLLAVGFLVEGVLVGRVFLLCYLLGGIGSAGLDLLLSPNSLIPGIGASGAISGLMGMYAVLYWNRSVRVFVFLFAYFDYVRLPAIVLLPLWVGNELYQMWANPESNINFIAHLGGLLSGATIAWVVKDTPLFNIEYVEEQDRAEGIQSRMNEARELCETQDFKSALPMLRALYKEQPDNHQVLYHLFMAERLYPDSESFHEVSLKILRLPMREAAVAAMVHEVFESYLRLAKPKARVNRELACHLLKGFRHAGKHEAAQRLQRMLDKYAMRCGDIDAFEHKVSEKT